MLVKELIQELQKINPEQEMVFHCDIETGRSLSICKEGDYDIHEEDLEEDEIKDLWREGHYDEDWTWEEIFEDDEDNEKSLKEFIKEYKPRLVFSISGEETDYQ